MKLVILDKGTVLDTISPPYNDMVAIFRHYECKPPTFDDYRDNFVANDSMELYWDRGIPPHVTARDLSRLRMEIHREEWATVALQPGAKELLNHCERLGFTIFLVTSGTYESTACSLQGPGARKPVEDRAYSRPPRREDLLDILALAKEMFGDEGPREVWYIDDMASGVAAAKNVPLEGIYTIGFTGGSNSPKMFEEIPQGQAPDHVVNSFFDIPPILDAYVALRDPAMQKPWAIN
jgi:phosphoglycolate phosphatase-like HAD superfamily hydrolase